MLKNRGIKCSWCRDESPTVFRNLWFSKPDPVTNKTENFGEMLVECYDLDPNEWSKKNMRDAVICYVCICSLRIAYNKKQDALAAARSKPIKDTTGKPQKQVSPKINNDLQSNTKIIDSRPQMSKGQSREPPKPMKLKILDNIDLDCKIDSTPPKLKMSKVEPQKATKSSASAKVELESKNVSRPQNSQKSKLPSSEPQRPIKYDKVDVVFKRIRTDPPQQSGTPAYLNIKEEKEFAEEEYVEEMVVEESEPGNETFMEEKCLEDTQPPKEIIGLERKMPDLKEEYLEETKCGIDKMDLEYQYEFLDHLSDKFDAVKGDTEDLNTKPNTNLKKSSQTKRKITEENLTIRKSKRSIKITSAAKEYKKELESTKHIVDNYKEDEMVMFPSEAEIKTDPESNDENCGDFDAVFLKDTNEDMYIPENGKLKNDVVDLSRGIRRKRGRPRAIRNMNTTLFNELILKLNNKQLTMGQAAEKMGLKTWMMRKYVSEHPKYIPRRKLDTHRLNEIIDKLNQKQLTVCEAAQEMGCSYFKLKASLRNHPRYIPMASKRTMKYKRWTAEQYRNAMEVLKAVDNNQMGLMEAAAKLRITRERLRTLLKKYTSYTGYKPSAGSKNKEDRPTETIADTICRIKAEYSEEEIRSMTVAVRQKKLTRKDAMDKLRCNHQALRLILGDKCASPSRVSSVMPEILVSEIQSILRYTNATPFKLAQRHALICAYCYCLRGKADKIDTPDELRAHTQIRHNAIRLVAVKRFTKLRQEILRVDITNLQCTVCATPLPSWHDMFSHLETIHSIKLVEAKSGVIPFILDSQNKTSFTCALCPKQFTGIFKLNQHMNTHATGNKCIVCNRTFMYNDLLKKHEQSAHYDPENINPESYSCQQCDRVTKCEATLKRHIATRHGQNMPKLCCCEYCGKAFNDHDTCAEHIHRLHEVKQKNFKERCNICLKIYPSKLKKDAHMRRVHNVNETYLCDWCPKTFALRKYLMKHLNSAHNQKTSLSYPNPEKL